MRRFLGIASVFLVLGLSPFSQSTQPLLAPDDFVLHFRIEGDQHQFHLGELIPVEYAYSTTAPGRYLWVSQGQTLQGGHSLDISCSPSAERVSLSPVSPESEKFNVMLQGTCGGVGGGMGGGCADCDWEQPLDSSGLHFGPLPLNMFIRFHEPGTYTCFLSAADVTSALSTNKIRHALLVRAKPVVLTLVQDPMWAASAGAAFVAAYDKLCRNDETASQLTQCGDIARRITYLDTPQSLAAEVQRFDGQSHGWENGFWQAIQDSSYPADALRLMTQRIQDPDVAVSPEILNWMAMQELANDEPDAFQTGDAAIYHEAATNTLRKFVRLLGDSLSRKNVARRQENVKTYRWFAEQPYCGLPSLIPREERNQILISAGVQQ